MVSELLKQALSPSIAAWTEVPDKDCYRTKADQLAGSGRQGGGKGLSGLTAHLALQRFTLPVRGSEALAIVAEMTKGGWRRACWNPRSSVATLACHVIFP